MSTPSGSEVARAGETGSRTRQVMPRKRSLEPPMNTLLRAAHLPLLLGRLAIVAMVTVGLTGVTSAVAEPAHATVSAGVGLRAVHVAATRRGAPYRWGAVGPRRFDCSGLTM